MPFTGEQKEFSYMQVNSGSINQVFPLLCPVREYDWLDGWTCKMIYSKSGLVELGCIFTTPHHGNAETTWYVSKYDSSNYTIEFIRITPGENVVRIFITLSPLNDQTTETFISYQYTGLNEQQNKFIKTELEDEFINSMKWWEKAINYYLVNGQMLKK